MIIYNSYRLVTSVEKRPRSIGILLHSIGEERLSGVGHLASDCGEMRKLILNPELVNRSTKFQSDPSEFDSRLLPRLSRPAIGSVSSRA
ncbi:hypothetical protein [Sphingomonas asaccharolytica]|uniref:hypothetical protein n=1 Tax=Sphingomonas asaccharolytica TaxID=40681 RepID=UPI0012EE7808|nr:hypothetical protein [Sphingomonas asaccharolytica]